MQTRQVGTMLLGLALANLAAWVWAWHALAGRPTLLGTALLAWVFGLRHAVYADHIAAIDNVVRKLMQAGERPASVGLFFSLGHSSVVIIACLAVAAAAGAVQQRLESVHAIGGVIGTSVSAAFLLAIAGVNLVILRDVWRRFRLARRTPHAIEDAHLASGGLLGTLLRPALRLVTKSWHMYPLGFLFGLGFDTATEIGLLGIAASQAANGLSAWQLLIFPALFTSGMALVDTCDSMLMVGAYGWAFVDPLRKLWYNLTITAASVVVALLIGGLEALGVIAEKLALDGGFWDAVRDLNDDLANFGFAVIGIFCLCWVVSAVIFRWKRLGEQAAGP